MGKARSFRLTKENEVRFGELVKLMKVDNPNLAFNRIIEDYHRFKSNERLLEALRIVVEELRQQGMNNV